ncbi:MAG: alpha-L-rhamnosidase C-terminal domain-containing protein [bacterium]
MTELTEVDCSYDSVYGKIRSSWKKTANNYTHQVTIPPNTTAIIGIPKRLFPGRTVETVILGVNTLWTKNRYSTQNAGITPDTEDSRFIKFAVLPGTWQFDVITAANSGPK